MTNPAQPGILIVVLVVPPTLNGTIIGCIMQAVTSVTGASALYSLFLLEQRMKGIFSEGYGIIPKAIMRSKDLNTTEKCIVAYFLSYTGQGGANECWPSVATIMEDLNFSSATMTKHIKSLCEKQYIEKLKLNPKNSFDRRIKYRLTFMDIELSNSKSSQLSNSKSSQLSNSKSSPNKNNEQKHIEQKHPKSAKKHKNGEFKHVLLTHDQKAKLVAEWGAELFDYMVKTLDEGIEMHGYKYKNHNLALRNWYKRQRSAPGCPSQNAGIRADPVMSDSKARAIELMGGKLIAREICEVLGITFDEWRERSKTEGVWDDLVQALEARDAQAG